MLDLRETGVGTEAIKKVIRALNDDFDKSKYVLTEVRVRAVVNDTEVLDDTIKTDFTFDGHNWGSINFYWEDSGYKNFKELGLYGQISSQWQRIKETGQRLLTVFGDTYTIEVYY